MQDQLLQCIFLSRWNSVKQLTTTELLARLPCFRHLFVRPQLLHSQSQLPSQASYVSEYKLLGLACSKNPCELPIPGSQIAAGCYLLIAPFKLGGSCWVGDFSYPNKSTWLKSYFPHLNGQLHVLRENDSFRVPDNNRCAPSLSLFPLHLFYSGFFVLSCLKYPLGIVLKVHCKPLKGIF